MQQTRSYVQLRDSFESILGLGDAGADMRYCTETLHICENLWHSLFEFEVRKQIWSQFITKQPLYPYLNEL